MTDSASYGNWVCENYNNWRANKCAYGYYYYDESINISLSYYNGSSLLDTKYIASTRRRRDNYEYYPSEQGRPPRGWAASVQFNTYEPTASRNFTLIAVPVLTGYTYKWDTSSSATVGTYNTNDVITLSNSTNIYAIAKANTYTLNYNLNSGTLSGNPTSITVTYNSAYNIPLPTRTNYTFNSWYTDSGLTSAINSSGEKWTLTTVTNLYAKWTGIQYNITWGLNGGTGGTSGVATINYGSTLSFPSSVNSPTKTGYTFAGWNDGTTTYDAGASFTYQFTTGKSYTAQWTVKQYTASYNANSGSSTPSSATVNYDASYKLPAAISRTGYTFNGWLTGSTNRAAGSSFTWNYTENTNFTAQWTVKQYTASYNANSGSSTPSSATVNYDASYTLPAAISRTGYTFNGWLTGSTNRAAGSSFTWNYTENTNFTAQWTVKQYTASYNANSGSSTPSSATVNYDASYTLPAAISRTGYTFSGWLTGSTNRGAGSSFTWNYTENTIFTAQWTVNTYIITFRDPAETDPNKNLSTSVVTYDVKYTFSNGSKANHTFVAWYTTSALTGSPIIADGSAFWTTASNTTLYAKFTINGYNLIFNTNGIGTTSGTGGTKTNSLVISDSVLTTTSTPPILIPKAVGYTFNGWFDATTSGTKKINNDGSGGYTMPSAATTLYAQWTDKISIRLSDLRDTFGEILPSSVSIGEYREIIGHQTTPKISTSLKSQFKGKGPNL
jgi:uncharacterized repeat protein (TIGR02543 family)